MLGIRLGMVMQSITTNVRKCAANGKTGNAQAGHNVNVCRIGAYAYSIQKTLTSAEDGAISSGGWLRCQRPVHGSGLVRVIFNNDHGERSILMATLNDGTPLLTNKPHLLIGDGSQLLDNSDAYRIPRRWSPESSPYSGDFSLKRGRQQCVHGHVFAQTTCSVLACQCLTHLTDFLSSVRISSHDR
jgi:hypothetical protein